MIDQATYTRIRFLWHEQGLKVKEISAIVGLCPKTVSKWLKARSYRPRAGTRRSSKIEPFEERIATLFIEDGLISTAKILPKIRAEGFDGGKTILATFIDKNRNGWARVALRDLASHRWMRHLIQGRIPAADLQYLVGSAIDPDDVVRLHKTVVAAPLKVRNRAVTVLAHLHGIPATTISRFLCLCVRTVNGYIKHFRNGRVDAVLDLSRKEVKKCDDPVYRDAVFAVLHAPPSDYGINRTSWTIPLIVQTMRKQGVTINKEGVRKIIKDAGYGFRKAKRVLTSTDPEYRQKLAAITEILSNLQMEEKFFSIDEFGPFAVRTQGGRSWSKDGERLTYPQWQRSKGSLILTGALELSTNQMTFFYSEKKNTREMVKLLHVLLERYHNERCIYFSWDAASWHASKLFHETVRGVNDPEYRREHGTPEVKLVPLPSSAQFLNVIESVFSGMAKAIIHNSDYQSVEECREAIDLYFEERNRHFREHPRRAGNKIWGKERVPPVFSESHNCKDPKWQ